VHPQPELWVSNDQLSDPALTKISRAPGIKTRHLDAEATFAGQQPQVGNGWAATTNGKVGVSTAAMGFTSAD